MSKEYIERGAICQAYMDLCMAKGRLVKARKGAVFFQSDLLPEAEPTVKELFGLINAAPAADVVEVKHGRWKWKRLGCVECSLCHKENNIRKFPYCPNCGAKMDGE